ncbi:MAG: spore protease YyaC [Clostridia bacterium]|nr:spore protease YyaC [Clostridia bacterium]
MLEVDVYNKQDQERLATAIKQKLTTDAPVYMCIGTEKVFSDSLGPRVGTLLNIQMQTPVFVYGMCDQNITAENLCYCYDFIKTMHPNSQIVVIDAGVGDSEQLGRVQLCDGGIVPGAATNKNLPEVGDIGIVGIVAERGMADFYTLNSTKDKLVGEVAKFIADAIMLTSQNGQILA